MSDCWNRLSFLLCICIPHKERLYTHSFFEDICFFIILYIGVPTCTYGHIVHASVPKHSQVPTEAQIGHEILEIGIIGEAPTVLGSSHEVKFSKREARALNCLAIYLTWGICILKNSHD